MTTSKVTVSSQSAGSKKKKAKNVELDRIKQLNTTELDKEYRRIAAEVWEVSWNMLVDPDDWKLESTSTDLQTGVIHSKHFGKLGKVFKLEGFVDASPESVFEETVIKVNETPQWNTAVTDCRTVHTIDEDTDISYNVTGAAAGGLFSSRDFVNLRHWKTRDGIMLSSGCAVLHPDMPPTKNHIRGDNRAGGWLFKPVEGNSDKCIFGWILNTDLKGWIPQYLVDQAISRVLLEFLNNLRGHMARVKNRTESITDDTVN